MASIANTVVVDQGYMTIVPSTAAVIGSGNISNAVSAVVTVANHGLVTGDRVTFKAITQANWLALTNNTYQITKITDNTFSIPVNSTTFGAYTDAAGNVCQDFDSTKYFPDGLKIVDIFFRQSNSADKLLIRHGSATGIAINGPLSNAAGNPIKEIVYRSQPAKPYFRQVATECVFTTASSVLIRINISGGDERWQTRLSMGLGLST